MAIYDRSNIDYSGMIRDMINAKTARAKIAADNIRRQGELWGNFAKDIGGVASRTWDSAHLDDTDMPGIANYVAFGDSSLLDRQLAEAAARHQMAEQQAFQSAERVKQQDFQSKEAIENRKLQEKLARMNKSLTNEEKFDDYMRLRNKAATALSFAKKRLDATPKENKADYEAAQRDLALAQHDLDYYNKKVGYKEPTETNPPNPKAEPETPKAEPETPKAETEVPKEDSREASKSVPVKLKDSKAIKRFKTRAARKAQANKLAAMDPNGQDPEIQEEIIRINGLDTDEDKAVRKNKWNEGKKLTGFDYRKWKESKEGKKLIEEFGE